MRAYSSRAHAFRRTHAGFQRRRARFGGLWRPPVFFRLSGKAHSAGARTGHTTGARAVISPGPLPVDRLHMRRVAGLVSAHARTLVASLPWARVSPPANRTRTHRYTAGAHAVSHGEPTRGIRPANRERTRRTTARDHAKCARRCAVCARYARACVRLDVRGSRVCARNLLRVSVRDARARVDTTAHCALRHTFHKWTLDTSGPMPSEWRRTGKQRPAQRVADLTTCAERTRESTGTTP